MELTGHSRQTPGLAQRMRGGGWWGGAGRVVRAEFHRRSTWPEWLQLHANWSAPTSLRPLLIASRPAAVKPEATLVKRSFTSTVPVRRRTHWKRATSQQQSRKQIVAIGLAPSKCPVGGVNRFQVHTFLNFGRIKKKCTGIIVTCFGQTRTGYTWNRDVHKTLLTSNCVASRWLALAWTGYACLAATVTVSTL